ncbi:MAG: M20 family metallopeptidase [Pirellulales bacterium]|nr:M20 family metallopeptidase [Pirellulales bacterium]
MKSIKEYVSRVSRRRLADDLWELVNMPSPTCGERRAALRFAEMLRECGAEVEVDENFSQSPNVIGRLRGTRPGRTLQLAGHIDHIDVPHPPPTRDEKIISGRGAADMKNGLAGILEITRLLHDRNDFAGELLVTVFGRHEAPRGDFRGLKSLLDRGVKGDAAIVFEGPDNAVVVTAIGMAIWNITLRRQGRACHEMAGSEKGWDLMRAMRDVLALLEVKNTALLKTAENYPLLPPESVFVGQSHYGDFYNRVPASAALQGTRRWHPGRTFEEIQAEFAAWLGEVKLPRGITLKIDWIEVGDAYEIDESEPIVQSMLWAWRNVADLKLSVCGHSSINDTCRLVAHGKVPAVLCAFDTETAHADYEFVRLDRMERACQVALAASIDYLSSEQ